MNLLLVPYWADHELDLIQWPPFLLASKVILIFEKKNDCIILFVAKQEFTLRFL